MACSLREREPGTVAMGGARRVDSMIHLAVSRSSIVVCKGGILCPAVEQLKTGRSEVKDGRTRLRQRAGPRHKTEVMNDHDDLCTLAIFSRMSTSLMRLQPFFLLCFLLFGDFCREMHPRCCAESLL